MWLLLLLLFFLKAFYEPRCVISFVSSMRRSRATCVCSKLSIRAHENSLTSRIFGSLSFVVAVAVVVAAVVVVDVVAFVLMFDDVSAARATPAVTDSECALARNTASPLSNDDGLDVVVNVASIKSRMASFCRRSSVSRRIFSRNASFFAC